MTSLLSLDQYQLSISTSTHILTRIQFISLQWTEHYNPYIASGGTRVIATVTIDVSVSECGRCFLITTTLSSHNRIHDNQSRQDVLFTFDVTTLEKTANNNEIKYKIK
jgi:hypothetical protein